MPEDVALAWEFTRATLAHDPSADDYRGEIVRRWGPRAVVTLAFAITTARMYPTVRYAMGHGQICSRTRRQRRAGGNQSHPPVKPVGLTPLASRARAMSHD